MKSEIGRVRKGEISLIEYDDSYGGSSFFLQSGVVGIYATSEELQDIYAVLNYYINLEQFSECSIQIGEEKNVAI